MCVQLPRQERKVGRGRTPDDGLPMEGRSASSRPSALFWRRLEIGAAEAEAMAAWSDDGAKARLRFSGFVSSGRPPRPERRQATVQPGKPGVGPSEGAWSRCASMEEGPRQSSAEGLPFCTPPGTSGIGNVRAATGNVARSNRRQPSHLRCLQAQAKAGAAPPIFAARTPRVVSVHVARLARQLPPAIGRAPSARAGRAPLTPSPATAAPTIPPAQERGPDMGGQAR